MRCAALLALVLANAGFSGPHAAPGSAGKQPRPTRIVEAASLPGWKATRDRDTGAIVSAWGGSILVPGSIADAAIAERAARAFATQIAPAGTTLVVAGNRVAHGQRTVVFQQMLNGLRVIDARVVVVFAHDRLFAAGSSAVPPATIVSPASRATAAKTEAWLRADNIAARLEVGERAVLPMIYGKGDLALEVVDVIDARDGLERWTVYAKPDGTPIERVSVTAHGSGSVRLDVPVRHPLGSRTRLAASRMTMTVDGIPLVSNSSGGVTWTGSGAATVIPAASGDLVRVIAAQGSPATGTLTLGNGGTVDWSLASSVEGDAQLNAYAWAMIAKTRARAINPTLAWLDQRLDITVNEPGSCNALSDGNALHFYGAGACENAARITDVVLHEFGHSFHTQSFLGGGTFDLALGEGLADFFAANITGDSGIGRGLNFTDDPVRDIEPDLRFPDNLSGDEHVTGLIVAGALWDLRKQFVADFGGGPSPIEAVYLGVVEHAHDLATAYVAALIGDDNDGDLGNGTPHQCAIEQAFAAHGLVPDFMTTKLATPVLDGRVVTLDVDVPDDAVCPRARVTGVDLVVQIGDAIETSSMIGDGKRFVGTLPEVITPAVIRYQVIAQLDDGSTLAMPNNAGDPMYQVMIGDVTPLWCDSLDADPKWMQSGRTAWEFGKPLGRSGDPAIAASGTSVLGTNLTGSGRYPAGSSAITTPVIDTTGFSDVHLQFYRWLTIEERTKDRAAIAIDGELIFANAIGSGLDHVDREWRFVDLPMPKGGAITWSIDANSDAELGGWNIDDVCVVTFDANACVDDCDPPELTDGGCCSSNRSSASVLLGGAVLLVLRRRRRTDRR